VNIMGQDTIAKLADIIKAHTTESDRAALSTLGVLDNYGRVVYAKNAQYGLKKVSDVPAEGRHYLGTIKVTVGPFAWPVSIVRTQKGSVIADAGIYRGTEKVGTGDAATTRTRPNFIPPFAEEAIAGAFGQLLRTLPEYLKAEGAI
jgi:hypothetical protein